MTDVAALPVRRFADPATIRLISTAYIEEPALAPLADDDNDLSVLESVEALTSARRQLQLPLPDGLQPGELLTEAHGYGWSYVNAAFCYTRPDGNRFNGPERGAWYAAYGDNAAETAKSEVGWHLRRELEAVGVFENLTAYRELLAAFATRFHDLSDFAGAPELGSDPGAAYHHGQALASGVLRSGGNGILYPSVRRPGGKCLAAFRPHLVQDVRQGDTWVFEWSDSPEPAITKG